MTDTLSFAVLSASSLFAAVNPLGAAPSFLSLTALQDPAARHRMALRASFAGLVVLWVFALAGPILLDAFGITLPALRIAGGVLFFLMGLPKLLGTVERDERVDPDADPSVVPLGIPLLSGPGAISTVTVLTGEAVTAWHTATLVLVATGTMAVSAVVLALAPRVLTALGKSGVAVVNRLMGLLVTVIGVQFVIDGVTDAFGLG